MNFKNLLFRLALLVHSLLMCELVTAQLAPHVNLRNVNLSQEDSTDLSIYNRVKAQQGVFNSGRELALQRRKLADLDRFEERLRNFIRYNFDTNDFKEELLKAELGKRIALEGLLDSTSGLITYRDLISSQNTLREIQASLESTKDRISQKLWQISNYQGQFDSLVVDSVLWAMPLTGVVNSEAKFDYLNLNRRLFEGYEQLTAMSDYYHMMKMQVAMLFENISYYQAEIDKKRNSLALQLFERELTGISKPFEDRTSFNLAVKSAYVKERELLFGYLRNNLFTVIILLCCALITVILLRKIVLVIDQNNTRDLFEDNPVYIYPALSVWFIYFILNQFVFFYAPFVFQGIFWLGAWVISIWWMIKKQKPFYQGWPFFVFTLLFPFIFFENLILEPYPFELWLLVGISFLIIFLAIADWIKRAKQVKSRFRYLFILLSFSSFILFAFIGLIFGRYNLSKIFLVTGYLGIFSAIMLFWVKDLWYAFLAIPIGKVNSHFQTRVYQNLQKMSKRSSFWVDLLIYLCVTVVFLRNFYVYNTLMEFISNEISKERFIGKYTFTWEEVLIFAGVLFATYLINRILTFFFDDQIFSSNTQKEKGGIKNWTLVMKLVVIIAGFLISFLAAGVPMNSITLIIGSLGLGIGFGLQGIVGNLISGIVIAFERPFEINDQVEWNGTFGRITEIGLRSSRILNMDGSEIVVPNSDLINQKLINWTHSNNFRRMEIIVGLPYETNLKQAKEVIERALSEVAFVRKYPIPQVLMNEFSNSSIACRILFWVEVDDMLEAKSEVMIAVQKNLEDAGIKIPFPQLDLHVIKS